jgi:hypothetical protein
MMTVAFAALALLFFQSRPLTDAWPRVAHRLALLLACIAGMIICFAFVSPGILPGTGSKDTLILLGYFALYVIFVGSAFAEILFQGWEHARSTWHRPVRHAGLLLLCAGAVTGLIGLAGQTGFAAVGAGRTAALPMPGGAACLGLAASPRCVFAATLPAIAVVLATAGAVLPVLAVAAADTWRYWRHLLMYRALEPLRDGLQLAFPQITLPRHGTRPRLDLTLRLYRRVIEIDDGCVLLRQYMRPGVDASATKEAAGYGLRGDALRATVEAAGIVAALRAHQAAGFDDPRPPDRTSAEVHDLAEQAAWLTKVARAYATSPIVYQLVTHRQ